MVGVEIKFLLVGDARTYYDGHAKWFEVWFRHKVVTVKTPLQRHAIHEWVLKAINTK